jgi:citrate synthase
MSTHLSAAAAAQRLGVSRATLYAYVSRGLIRSRPVAPRRPGAPARGRRAHEYAREDVEHLLTQALGRRDPLGVAQRALEFDGLPVMSSALCLIDGGRLYYRGRDAVQLSAEARFEDVAALLWDGPCRLPAPHAAPAATARRRLARLELAAAAISHLAQLDARAPVRVLDPDGVRAAGAHILAELVALVRGFAPGRGSVAQQVGAALGARGPAARRAIEAALILCADHELNASAFTARVVASAGATPYMAVIGALGALSGQRHGGTTASVAALFDERGSPSDVVAARVSRGELIPGFGHRLYPDGDPRAQRLLELCPKGAARTRALALAAAVEAALGVHANVDFALVALGRALRLVPHAPFALFAIGRSAGWIGHVLEQHIAGTLIRPRARYVGVAPGGAPESAGRGRGRLALA